MFFGEVTLYDSEWCCNSKINRSKVKVTGNENVKLVFRAYLRQKRQCIDLRQTKTKMINDPFYTCFVLAIFVCLSVCHIPHIRLVHSIGTW